MNFKILRSDVVQIPDERTFPGGSQFQSSLSRLSPIAKRAKKKGNNYIVLGDFNIPDVNDSMMQALEDNGFHIPNPIKEHPTDLGETKHYDQMLSTCT